MVNPTVRMLSIDWDAIAPWSPCRPPPIPPEISWGICQHSNAVR
ncbi:MAG: hypothetical protein AAFX95_09775 [Cyanobacteria bacterium J06639_16]